MPAHMRRRAANPRRRVSARRRTAESAAAAGPRLSASTYRSARPWRRRRPRCGVAGARDPRPPAAGRAAHRAPEPRRRRQARRPPQAQHVGRRTAHAAAAVAAAVVWIAAPPSRYQPPRPRAALQPRAAQQAHAARRAAGTAPATAGSRLRLAQPATARAAPTQCLARQLEPTPRRRRTLAAACWGCWARGPHGARGAAASFGRAAGRPRNAAAHRSRARRTGSSRWMAAAGGFSVASRQGSSTPASATKAAACCGRCRCLGSATPRPRTIPCTSWMCARACTRARPHAARLAAAARRARCCRMVEMRMPGREAVARPMGMPQFPPLPLTPTRQWPLLLTRQRTNLLSAGLPSSACGCAARADARRLRSAGDDAEWHSPIPALTPAAAAGCLRRRCQHGAAQA
eukprot:50890-Chlamydomonas_euryale.AAC.2